SWPLRPRPRARPWGQGGRGVEGLSGSLDGITDAGDRTERRVVERERSWEASMSRKVSLDVIEVPSPCPESWEGMKGDGPVRFCGLCEMNVYNLSAMTRDEAEALVRER